MTWRPANNGAGKRIWFLIDEDARPTRYHASKTDTLIRYATMSSAQRAADELNRAEIAETLEYLRGEIDAERISQGELLLLQELADHIEPGDMQLLEWAGVPEFREEVCRACGSTEADPDHGLCDKCWENGALPRWVGGDEPDTEAC